MLLLLMVFLIVCLCNILIFLSDKIRTFSSIARVAFVSVRTRV